MRPYLSSRRPRVAAVAILAVALAGPWASAAAGPRRQATSAHAASASASLLDHVWSLWARLWSLAADAGCHLDPDGGKCATSSAKPSPIVVPDEGCHLDPDGRCLGG